MAANAVWIGVPKTWQGQVSAANTNRDGTGTLVTIVTAGASGSRIDRVAIEATVTTTAGMVRLFLHDGTNARLRREVKIDAITPSATDKVFEAEVVFPDGLFLPTGWSLRASTHNAEAINVFAHGGDI